MINCNVISTSLLVRNYKQLQIIILLQDYTFVSKSNLREQIV